MGGMIFCTTAYPDVASGQVFTCPTLVLPGRRTRCWPSMRAKLLLKPAVAAITTNTANGAGKGDHRPSQQQITSSAAETVVRQLYSHQKIDRRCNGSRRNALTPAGDGDQTGPERRIRPAGRGGCPGAAAVIYNYDALRIHTLKDVLGEDGEDQVTAGDRPADRLQNTGSSSQSSIQ